MASYTSSGSGNWNNAATWGGAGVPVAGDDATIDNAAHVITVSAAAECEAVFLNKGTIRVQTSLTVNNNLNIGDGSGSLALVTAVSGVGGGLSARFINFSANGQMGPDATSGLAFTVITNYPAASDVREGVQFDFPVPPFVPQPVGTLVLPDETDVAEGVQYGADGTEFEGELVAGGSGGVIGG